MRRMRKMAMILMAVFIVAGAAAQLPPWNVMSTGTNTNLRGASYVYPPYFSSTPVLWASGSNGVVQRIGGLENQWKQIHVADGDALDFRGIRAFDEKIAYLISSGAGDKSRIYKTIDGGENWEMQFTDKRPAFFLDDIVCFNETHCFVLGDPIDGKFLILSTEDGKHWNELPRDGMPPIIAGEGAFAASGSSLAIFGTSDIYFGTGGGATARVFHSADLGKTWSVAETPLASGNASSGVFSVTRVRNTVIAVGGDYRVAGGTARVAAYSVDGGATWQLATKQPGGYRSAVASVGGSTLVSAGPNGEDISYDFGITWNSSGTVNLNALAVLDNNMWGVGARGTVARFIGQSPEKLR
jgi:photosystem II stability/assembly factor-like uncharacterized protein